MDVILLEKLGRFGGVGDRASVKAGFARNYLIPRGKAVFATEKNIAEFESRRADLESNEMKKLESARTKAKFLSELGDVVIKVIAGDEGKLFGSVGARDIADAITQLGGEVSRGEVSMPDGSIRQTGNFEIDVLLHPDVHQSVKILIEAA
ncbi:MAG: 50S ribosomal protein L9 [Cellvibrionales bacterium TMED49]|nr:50S ribosomal protein L9 [Porticoccaceae bacterium]OUU39586.1 MAG: 50S ribosomal protein L9 [Cellvibrionales bacterium TMED49]|tara:strand:- start:179 stop:628 length:450 start_codon:yes stop_codon:yes gene_type:complete